MIGQNDTRESRERQILSKAIEAFGAHGVKGASLRDIAKDADVSLALISHYFGDKPGLVSAATQQVKVSCGPALARLRMRLQQGPGWSTAYLVECWLDYLQDAFGSHATRPHLKLIQRLRSDPSTEQAVVASLDLAEPVMRQALVGAYPHACALAVERVLNASRAVLVAAFTDEATIDSQPTSSVAPAEGARALLLRFLESAIEASLGAQGTDA